MNAFVARQPIFDRKLGVFGYELLFRSGPESCFPSGTDLDCASSRTVSDGLTLMGLDTVTLGKRAFINVSRNVLVKDLVMTLPKNQVVVELHETIEPDEEIVAACRRLKRAGYLLALDDYVEHPDDGAMVAMADFVKVDVRSTSTQEREKLGRKLAVRGIRMLAEKVETKDELTGAVPNGYTFFQGYFFSRPTLVATRDIPGFRLNYLRLLQELNQPEISLHRLDELIKQEMSIAYRVLRYVNSAAIGPRRKMDRPMEEVLSALSVPRDVRDGLVPGVGPLRAALDVTVAFERGDWSACTASALALGIGEEEIAAAYHEASRWATEVFSVA